MVIIPGQFWQAPPVEGGPPITTGISPNETDTLVRLAGGRRVLEIGSAYGYSAVVMALAGATVLTIDTHDGINADSLNILRSNIAAYRVADRVVPLVGDSRHILPALAATNARFDFVFVDGDNKFDVVSSDLEYGWQMLRRGGWLARHDYHEAGSPEIAMALDVRWPQGPDKVTRTLWVKRKR